jgi:hypothetical protein
MKVWLKGCRGKYVDRQETQNAIPVGRVGVSGRVCCVQVVFSTEPGITDV